MLIINLIFEKIKSNFDKALFRFNIFTTTCNKNEQL